jgi:hypothetical protein
MTQSNGVFRRPRLFIIRGRGGSLEAIHERIDTRQGKRFRWWTAGPDGEPTPSLQGRPVRDLPLFGGQHAAKWDRSRGVFVVEGEKDALALSNAGHRAVGTVGGACVVPSDGSLAVLVGLHIVLWADADPPGVLLMQAIAQRLQEAAASLSWATWPGAPAGGGAADYLAAGLRVEDLTIGPVPTPEQPPGVVITFSDAEKRLRGRMAAPIRRGSPITAFNASVPVSEVLRRDYALAAVPGRDVRCAFHDDRHPSLSVLADDRRVYCHAPGCWAHNAGQGRDAWDLAHALDRAVAR